VLSTDAEGLIILRILRTPNPIIVHYYLFKLKDEKDIRPSGYLFHSPKNNNYHYS
jgi:hypothetical protein